MAKTTVTIADIAGDFNDADPTATGSGGRQLPWGHHKVRIDSVKFKPSEKKKNKYWFIVEFTLLASTSSQAEVGEEYSWSHDLTNEFFGMANAKQFLAAACGFDPASPQAHGLTTADLQEAVDDEQPLRGRVAKVHVKPKVTEGTSKENPFPVHDWSPWLKDTVLPAASEVEEGED